jgi:hypothetical protein
VLVVVVPIVVGFFAVRAIVRADKRARARKASVTGAIAKPLAPVTVDSEGMPF